MGCAGEADAEREVVEAGDADRLFVNALENSGNRGEEDYRDELVWKKVCIERTTYGTMCRR